MPIGKRRQRRHFADQPIGLIVARLDVENFLGVRIERRQRSHRAEHHSHRMGIMMEAVDEFFYVFVDDRVIGYVVAPFFEL